MSRDIYLIGDTHFDHSEIIKTNHRPFRNKEEMNDILINNWNRTVRPDDKVIFLGDLYHEKDNRKGKKVNKKWNNSYRKEKRDFDYWQKYLNGDITFIRGNHDRSCTRFLHDFLILKYANKKFILIHDLKQAPFKWDGWIIHGHQHNNQLERFPLVHGINKTINVDVDLIDYKPIRLDELINADLDHIQYWKTIKDEPVYFPYM